MKRSCSGPIVRTVLLIIMRIVISGCTRSLHPTREWYSVVARTCGLPCFWTLVGHYWHSKLPGVLTHGSDSHSPTAER
jgi:hypothetical protein